MDFYGSVDGLVEYAAARGVTLASGDRTAALVRGSMSLDAVYGARYIGTKAVYSSDREWPRSGAEWPDGTAVTGVPRQVEYAAYEMAVQELVRPGSTTPTVTPGKVRKRSRVEGAVDVEYARDWWSADLVATMIPISTTIEGILRDLVGLRVPSPAALVV